jgi:hypothetical protein
VCLLFAAGEICLAALSRVSNNNIPWLHWAQSLIHSAKHYSQSNSDSVFCIRIFLSFTLLSTRCYPKSPQNWNAMHKPLVVQLCATRYFELYSLWTILPCSVLLWGRVFFFYTFFWRRVSAVLWLYQPKMMWRSNRFASGSCVTRCAAVFGFYKDDSHSPPSLFNGPRPYSPPRSYFRRWNWISRSDVLTALKRSRPNCRTWWGCWCKMISSSVSNHGNPAGIAVSMQKGMEANRNLCKWLSYGRGILGTFG